MARSPASIELMAALTVVGMTGVACAQKPRAAIKAETKSMSDASATVTRANQAYDAGRFEEASGLYDQAIAAVGGSYARAGVIDDTGQKLAIAKAQAGKGEWRSAASLKKSVIEARLSLAASAK